MPILADIDRIGARPIVLAWCPWWGPIGPEPAATPSILPPPSRHANGTPGTAGYRPRISYFEIMNEPT